MCPLFEEYSQLSVALDKHSDNDSLHKSLVMISDKVLMDLLEVLIITLLYLYTDNGSYSKKLNLCLDFYFSAYTGMNYQQ